jgi:uncharacterized damage-inducible protein DinB
VAAEPEVAFPDETSGFAAYLSYYREEIAEAVLKLSAADQRATRIASGWTPIELLSHVLHMEQRWFVWGFLGEPLADPWGDSSGAPERPWHVPADRDLDQVVAFVAEQAARTSAVLVASRPEDVAAGTGRFAGQPQPPTLRWICFHVLQEYARHAGHLDVAVELAGGHTGE